MFAGRPLTAFFLAGLPFGELVRSIVSGGRRVVGLEKLNLSPSCIILGGEVEAMLDSAVE